MKRKYYTEEQILEALSEVGIGAGDISEVMSCLGRMPSAEKTGKWISQVGGGYCCSKCGRHALHDVDGKFALLFTKSKYCPNCGARMVVEDD